MQITWIVAGSKFLNQKNQILSRYKYCHIAMIKELYISSLEEDDSKIEGHFLLTIEGDILACNEYASKLLKYNTPKEVINLNYRVMVPDEFADNLPKKITIEHLTNEEYLDRVNVCKDGTLINTKVLTKYVYFDSTCFVECKIRPNKKNVITTNEHRYKQVTELLKCEILALKKREKFAQEKYTNENIREKLTLNNLTEKEIAFCSLLYAGMHTKEISSLINLTIASTYKLRKRLRKKLLLPPEEDLKDFLKRKVM